MATKAIPNLSKIEGQVLRTVRFSYRDERWDHPTLCQLRAFGYVISEAIAAKRDGISPSSLRWRITDAGIAAYNEWRA